MQTNNVYGSNIRLVLVYVSKERNRVNQQQSKILVLNLIVQQILFLWDVIAVNQLLKKLTKNALNRQEGLNGLNRLDRNLLKYVQFYVQEILNVKRFHLMLMAGASYRN